MSSTRGSSRPTDGTHVSSFLNWQASSLPLAPPTYTQSHKHKWLWQNQSYSSRRRQWHPTPVLLPGKSHGRRSLVGCSPLGPQELDMTQRLHFHFSLLCTGEGNGNPLQCSCLENPRDGGAWWAAIHGVAQSRTRLKRLSSSSSSHSSQCLQIQMFFSSRRYEEIQTMDYDKAMRMNDLQLHTATAMQE